MASERASPHGGSEASLVVFCAPRDERNLPLLAALAVYAPLHVDPSVVAETDFRMIKSEKVAVVGLGEAAPSEAGLRAIRELRKAHFDVIGWARGSDGWPVALLARAFVAGADAVLDCEQPDAAERIGLRVADCLRSRAKRKEEHDRLLRQMRDLGIVGRGPEMLSLFSDVLRVSRLSDVPVLISGETGTGKELVAHAIHALDANRRAGPFVALNCAALNSGVAESELFGHHRGAFTGADRNRPGLFRSASGGILFLDEVGELEPGLQAKLLRVLQDGRVLGVGEDRETAVDARVVAATNRSLPDMVTNGKFRTDLYHRLSATNLHLPPLRERRDDVPVLVAHFVEKHRKLAASPIVDVSPKFVEAVARLDLPGNARELENLVRRALLAKTDGGPLGLSDLPREVWLELTSPIVDESQRAAVPEPRAHDVASLATLLLDVCSTQNWELPRLLREVERHVLNAAIESVHGDLTKAGVALGLKPRTLYNKRHKHRFSA